MEWGKQKFKTEIPLHCKKARLSTPQIGAGTKILIMCAHKFYSNVSQVLLSDAGSEFNGNSKLSPHK